LAEVIQWIQSRRALGVMSDQTVRAFGAATANVILLILRRLGRF